MKARDQLRNVLLHHGWHPEQVDVMLDNFAHELAEEIRGDRDDMNIPGSPATPDAIDAMSYAASVIDPQDREGVRPDEEPTP